MRILITGGAGFIGSALVRHLIGETAHSVLNYDKLTYAGTLTTVDSVRANARYGFVQADVCDAAQAARAIAEIDADAVMHLAAESHVDRSIDGPAQFVLTNVVGTQTMLHAALEHWRKLSGERQRAFRFLHISTDEVFGSLGPDGLFTEETAYDPRSPYSASKAGSDHIARAYQHTYGLPVIVTNCSNNYGPFQFPEKLIPLMIIKALSGEKLPVYGKGENIRDWLYVKDHVRALTLALEHGMPGETYNVGGNSEQTNINVVRHICAILDQARPRAGKKPYADLIGFVADRPGHDLRYAIDASKIARELGWTPRETFESGMARTVQWYLENETWWRAIQQRSYAGGRLGLEAKSA